MTIGNVLGVSALGLALVVSSPVLARKDKTATTDTAVAGPIIELTNIARLDAILGKAQEIEGKIITASTNLATARANLMTALGAATNASLATALADMKTKGAGKIEFHMNGTTPTLGAGDGMPVDVKAGLDATNNLIRVGNETVTLLAGLGHDILGLVSEAKALPRMVPSLGLDPPSLMSATKILGKDVKAIADFPNKVAALTDQVTGIINDVKTAFSG